MDGDEGTPVPQLRRAPAERLARSVLPACGVVWTAAEILHAAHVPPAEVAMAAALAAALAYGTTGHHAKDRKAARRHARHAATGTLTMGTWLAIATRTGALAGPWCAMTVAWAGISLVGWLWLRRHELVVKAREWRNARTDWLSACRRWGLGGSHLLHHEQTRLGERMIADVTGTGRRASQIARGDVAERIAEDRGLPVTRVQVRPHRVAGQLEISIRDVNPWAHPITHPVLTGAPEIDLSGPYSARSPAVVGQDPESGRPLTLPLCSDVGGVNISVVGIKGAGKTVLLSNISERATKAPDALLFRINLSIKGDAEAQMWAPACHLTALGRKQVARAVRVLRVISRIIEWRSQQPRLTADFVPSPSSPLIVLIVDEAGSATEIPAIKKELENISSRGREFGVTYVSADQRGTAERQGGANIRSQQDVFCLGMVNRRGEMMHAAGDLGLTMPDMASYGEGCKGVWVIAELGGEQQTGRTFNLKEPSDIADIVRQRAPYQPDLQPELKAFLGDSYENLLSTDVYARWAAQQEERPVTAHPRPDMAPGSVPDGTAPLNPVHALALAVRDGAVLADDETAETLRKALDVHEKEQAILAAYDREAEDHMSGLGDDELAAKLRRAAERDADTARILAENAARPVPQIDPAKEAEHTAARWRQVGEAAEIPDEARETLTRLVAAGTTVRQVADALGVKTWTARTYLERMRLDGQAEVTGKGRASRWIAPQDGDGS